MGCCWSREQDNAAGDDGTAPPPHHGATSSTGNGHSAPHSSMRPIQAPPVDPFQDAHSTGAPAPKPGSRPNKPLVDFPHGRKANLPDPYRTPTTTDSQRPHLEPWTHSRLEKERNAWWETRVTGDPQVWGLYREITDRWRRGETRKAQGLLDVVGCTCPSGKLWHGIYDATGVHYTTENALWVLFEPPEELAPEDVTTDEELSGQAGPSKASPKGKARAGEPVKVRCRLSNSNQDVVVQVSKGESVGILRERLGQQTNIDPMRFRLSLMGKTFSDTESFPLDGARAYKPGNVVSVFVKPEAFAAEQLESAKGTTSNK